MYPCPRMTVFLFLHIVLPTCIFLFIVCITRVNSYQELINYHVSLLAQNHILFYQKLDYSKDTVKELPVFQVQNNKIQFHLSQTMS